MKTYKTPYGKITKSVEVYVRAWRNLGKHVEVRFPGFKLTAFDPGLKFTRWEKRGDFDHAADSFELSADAAMRLYESTHPIEKINP